LGVGGHALSAEGGVLVGADIATSLPITLPADSPTGLQREHEIRGPL
jgi:hypothetical protein